MAHLKQAAFWLALLVLTTLSLLPTGLLPPQAFSLWDKAQHALGFAVLTGLCLTAYPSRPYRVAGLMLLHGGLIELAQAVTGWRYGDPLDLLADAVGIAAATGLWQLWQRRLGR